jgi:hypothetical protein
MVAGSIPYVIGFLNLPDPSSCTMTLGWTQPLTELSTRNIPGGVKGGWRVRLTSLLPSVSQLSRRCGSLDLSPLWAFMAYHRDSFTFTYIIMMHLQRCFKQRIYYFRSYYIYSTVLKNLRGKTALYKYILSHTGRCCQNHFTIMMDQNE